MLTYADADAGVLSISTSLYMPEVEEEGGALRVDDLAQLPELLADFETLFMQHKYTGALASVERAL